MVISNIRYSGKSISIVNGKVFIDGKDVTPDTKEIYIAVEGDIDELTVDHCNNLHIVGNVNKASSSSGNINVTGNVSESVQTSSGDVDCINVGGSVRTSSGDVTCSDVNGSVSTTSGNIKRKK